MSLDLVKVANVLDAAADHFDAIEAEKLSSVNATRKAHIDALAAKYATATGEEMPDTVRQKLSTSDQDIITLVHSMVEKQAGALESLGASSSRDDGTVPRTVKEAADDADDKFLSWVLT